MAGDQTACYALVARHQDAVYNLALRLVRDPAAAEDVAQDTFLKTFQRLQTFDTARPFVPWLLRIAHNTAVDALRRAGPPTTSLDHEVADVSAGSGRPLVRVEQREMREALTEALDRLRPEYRAAIVLRYHEELSYADVAHVMGVPEGTAKTYVHRGRRAMADLLAAAGWRS